MPLSLPGSLIVALAGVAPAFAIGLIGAKGVEAIGRNPEASSKILPVVLLGMAFAEALAIYAIVVVFVGL